MIGNVAVTVDGTWQKRGHTSKISVVFVMSVVTGEVLDYAVKSLSCHKCIARNKMDKESDNFKTWYETHKYSCLINHQGSSDSMETHGATEIFLRSVEKHKLKCMTFVGDGDSLCFVVAAKSCNEVFNGQYIVTKEECVGHVQKRIGRSLREYKRKMRGKKLSDNNDVGGRGRLTDGMIDKIQNYYGQAIRNNIDDIDNMKKSAWAIFYHVINDDRCSMEEQHRYCPQENDTWYKFWYDKCHNTTLYKGDNRLPFVFRYELNPIFERLSDEKPLGRCLRGLTQNQNESLNGDLWAHCPKNKFCGFRRIELAVCQTICKFNTGAASRLPILEAVGVKPGFNMLAAFRREDNIRVKNADYKCSMKSRIDSRKRRRERKSKTNTSDKVTYLSGGFGLSSEPEVDFYMQQNEVLITFIDEKDIPLLVICDNV